jgi:hypothetical protein
MRGGIMQTILRTELTIKVYCKWSEDKRFLTCRAEIPLAMNEFSTHTYEGEVWGKESYFGHHRTTDFTLGYVSPEGDVAAIWLGPHPWLAPQRFIDKIIKPDLKRRARQIRAAAGLPLSDDGLIYFSEEYEK